MQALGRSERAAELEGGNASPGENEIPSERAAVEREAEGRGEAEAKGEKKKLEHRNSLSEEETQKNNPPPPPLVLPLPFPGSETAQDERFARREPPGREQVLENWLPGDARGV